MVENCHLPRRKRTGVLPPVSRAPNRKATGIEATFAGASRRWTPMRHPLTIEVGAASWHCPNEKWGPALLPAPICAERRIRRCSSALVTRRSPAPRSWLTSSGVASKKWIPIRRRVPFPFRGPSWTDPLSRRLLPEGGRVSRKKDWLFRRLFQLVRTGTEVLVHRLPVEIGPSVPSSSFCVVADVSGEAGTSVPITPLLCA